jgi:alginate O-acetyltransferase complex protein AlgI
MGFPSFAFILIFLPVVVILYRILASRFSSAAANSFLLLASAVFYIQSSLTNSILLIVSILFNTFIGKRIRSAPENSTGFWLTTGITANVAFLCYFKYAAFLFATAAPFFGLSSTGWKVVFPLGISFFTIQQIIYLMDVYERLCEPNSLFDHSLVVSYFPYVSAGPITRVRDMVKQLHAPPNQDGGNDLAVGLLRFSQGLFKKVVLADTVAIVVNAGFDQPGSMGMAEAWLTCFLYAIQMFLDFSGYSDMAIGIGRMLGHVLPENFNGNPLTATSLTDFWQRWHMTLTNFITNYLYTPILRSWGKVTRQKAMAATLLSMAIAGMWHGSGITFLIFGLLHGAGLATHLAWKGAKQKMPNLLGTFLTLLLICFAFLFFRSPDMTVAGKMLAAVSGGHGILTASPFSVLGPALKSNWRITGIICVIAPLVAFIGPSTAQIAKTCLFTRPLAFGVASALLLSFLFLNSIPEKGFIYVGF